VPVSVRVYGLEREESGEEGEEIEIRVPSGTFDLAVDADGEYDTLEFTGLIAVGGETVSAGTLDIVRPCDSYACDSAVVRTILDSNGLQEVSVDSVSEAEGGRITELSFEGYASFTSLLPAIACLTALTELEISGCPLTGLPDEIGRMAQIHELTLTSLGLTSLPQSIVNLVNLSEADLSGNKLCGLSEEQKQWADIADPNWENGQECTGQ
jgi:hypothetical protein